MSTKHVKGDDEILAFLGKKNNLYIFLNNARSDIYHGKFLDYKGRSGNIDVVIAEKCPAMADIDMKDFTGIDSNLKLTINAYYFLVFNEKNMTFNIGTSHLNIIDPKRKPFHESKIYYKLKKAFGDKE